MCFSQEMSALFSVLGICFAAWIAKTNGNQHLLQGVGWFVLMEVLQVVQYAFIARDIDPANPTLAQMQKSPQCRSSANKFLTFLGFVHICFQPYFSAKLSCAFVRRPENTAQFKLVQRLQLVGAGLLLWRYLGTFITAETMQSWGFSATNAFDASMWVASPEWLSGPALCTYFGFKHLAWSVPFTPATYYSPSMALHMFLMFVPFFVLDMGSLAKNAINWIAGVLLFLTGPVLADYLTPNKQEAASIWCFFSICQVVGLVAMTVVKFMMRGEWYAGSDGAVDGRSSPRLLAQKTG